MSLEDRLFTLPKLVIPSPSSASAAWLVNRILVRAALKAGVLDAMAEWLMLICCNTITSEFWNHSFMQKLAWPVVNASDCLQQYFVICKEQPGQAQTSQGSWHFITCMCTFWQRNWIDDCSCFMWIQCGFEVNCKQWQETKQYNTASQVLPQKVSSNPSQASLGWVGLINWFNLANNQSYLAYKHLLID